MVNWRRTVRQARSRSRHHSLIGLAHVHVSLPSSVETTNDLAALPISALGARTTLGHSVPRTPKPIA